MEEKIKAFLARYEDNMTLYNMAVGFVLDNGFVAVGRMTREEFDAAINKEREFFSNSANALFDAAKDIVESCTPLVLCSIVGHNSDSVYRNNIHGADAVRATAGCPVCGKSYFNYDAKSAQYKCCGCGYTVRDAEELTPALGGKKAEAPRPVTLGSIIRFVDEYGDELTDYNSITEQMKALWTAYCLCNDMEPDTAAYDSEAAAIWQRVMEKCPNSVWSRKSDSFEAFDLYMCSALC